MNCCAVIDTNVLVSALLSSNGYAATVQVIARMLAGEITPVYSGAIMDEYRRVLGRPKSPFPQTPSTTCCQRSRNTAFWWSPIPQALSFRT